MPVLPLRRHLRIVGVLLVVLAAAARERLVAAELKVQAVLEEAGGDIRLTDLDA